MTEFTNEQLADFFVERLLGETSPRDAKTRRLRKFLKKYSSLETRMRFLAGKVRDSQGLRTAMLETTDKITDPVGCSDYMEMLTRTADLLGVSQQTLDSCNAIEDLELDLLVTAEKSGYYAQKEKRAADAQADKAKQAQGGSVVQETLWTSIMTLLAIIIAPVIEFPIMSLIVVLLVYFFLPSVFSFTKAILILCLAAVACLALTSLWLQLARNYKVFGKIHESLQRKPQEDASPVFASEEELHEELISRTMELARARMDCSGGARP